MAGRSKFCGELLGGRAIRCGSHAHSIKFVATSTTLRHCNVKSLASELLREALRIHAAREAPELHHPAATRSGLRGGRNGRMPGIRVRGTHAG